MCVWQKISMSLSFQCLHHSIDFKAHDIAIFTINNTQPNDTQHNDIWQHDCFTATIGINDTYHRLLLHWVSHFLKWYAECRYAKCRSTFLPFLAKEVWTAPPGVNVIQLFSSLTLTQNKLECLFLACPTFSSRGPYPQQHIRLTCSLYFKHSTFANDTSRVVRKI